MNYVYFFPLESRRRRETPGKKNIIDVFIIKETTMYPWVVLEQRLILIGFISEHYRNGLSNI